MTRGPLTSARAMALPVGEADLGQRLRGACASLRGRPAQKERRDHRVLEGRELAKQVVELEDEAHLVPAELHELGFRPGEEIDAVHQDAAPRGPIERAEEVQERRL